MTSSTTTRLAPSTRTRSRQFESHFLCTAERRAKLEFALALRGYAREEPADRRGAVSWLRAPSALPRWAVAAAASLLVLVPG